MPSISRELEHAIVRVQELTAEIGLPAARRHVVAINGTPAKTILDTVKDVSAELIVMGANRRKGLERLLIGSVAEDVIRVREHDILIVPEASN